MTQVLMSATQHGLLLSSQSHKPVSGDGLLQHFQRDFGFTLRTSSVTIFIGLFNRNIISFISSSERAQRLADPVCAFTTEVMGLAAKTVIFTLQGLDFWMI